MNLIIRKDKSSILTSILFLVLGILLAINPGGIIKFLTYIIGLIFCIFGSIKLFSYYKFKNEVSNIELTLGITAIIIGIIIMFCNSVIEFVIRLIMGGYILASGINKLIIAFNTKNYNDKWIGLLIVAGLLIICGLYIILKSNIILSSIGIVLIIYSSIDIISYLMYPKNKEIIK